MAPDIASLPAAEAAASGTYEIDKEVMIGGYQRKLRVLTVGAGVSGIMMAYMIQKDSKNVEHVIYEKNPDIGGTWYENRYPNCACDVPSHAYIYSFAPNVSRLPILMLVSGCANSSSNLILARLAEFLFLLQRHLGLPRSSLRNFRSSQVHDLQYPGGRSVLGRRGWRMARGAFSESS
jgi:hypothetical protein